MSKFAVETSIRSIRMAQRLFQRLSAAPAGTARLRESPRSSQNATNGLMKLTIQLVAGIRVVRAEDRFTVLGSRRWSSSRGPRGGRCAARAEAGQTCCGNVLLSATTHQRDDLHADLSAALQHHMSSTVKHIASLASLIVFRSSSSH